MASSNLISCNSSTFSSSKLNDTKPTSSLRTHSLRPRPPLLPRTLSGVSIFLGTQSVKASVFQFQQKTLPLLHRRALNSQNSEDPVPSSNSEGVSETEVERIRTGNVSEGSGWSDWTTSVMLFGIWAALMYYIFNLSANQTPTRDMYFVKKLLFLKGDDGFRMNQVLVAVWNIMGVWPLVYSQLLLPSARSSNSKVKAWPFIVLSFFGGVYALLPYFVLWKPPPPPVEEAELQRWPLNFLESKLTAGISFAAGVGLLVYAGLASGEDWIEFFRYFRESRLVHATSLDFTLLSALAPFWVYNDITYRKWFDKGSWLLPISLVPFFGPALYVLLRPPVPTLPASLSNKASDKS